MHDSLKSAALATPLFGPAWAAFRRRQLHAQDSRRPEHYRALASEQGLIYDEEETANLVRERMACRGYDPPKRELGDIHTFAFIPRVGWHTALYSDLEELGPVTEFDYIAFGY